MVVFENGIVLLDWLGIIAFTITGALVASRNQMDVVGFILLGTVTGIGGGTIRDLFVEDSARDNALPGVDTAQGGGAVGVALAEAVRPLVVWCIPCRAVAALSTVGAVLASSSVVPGAAAAASFDSPSGRPAAPASPSAAGDFVPEPRRESPVRFRCASRSA